ncbi:hypothetical protein PSAB6_190034 [Paraburkholderia sabiae]|nr:hypothetical protein PSAB6_190034 [Paraburkholderia sabiae]
MKSRPFWPGLRRAKTEAKGLASFETGDYSNKIRYVATAARDGVADGLSQAGAGRCGCGNAAPLSKLALADSTGFPVDTFRSQIRRQIERLCGKSVPNPSNRHESWP